MDETRGTHSQSRNPGVEADGEAVGEMTPAAPGGRENVGNRSTDDEIVVEHISVGSSQRSSDAATQTHTMTTEAGIEDKAGVLLTNASRSPSSDEAVGIQEPPEQHGALRKRWEAIRGWTHWRGILHLLLWMLITR